MKIEISGKVVAKMADDWGGLTIVIDDGATKIPVRFTGFAREDANAAGPNARVTVQASLGGREKNGKWYVSVDGGTCAITEAAPTEREPGSDDGGGRIPF